MPEMIILMGEDRMHKAIESLKKEIGFNKNRKS
jgi:hypothetical protein